MTTQLFKNKATATGQAEQKKRVEQERFFSKNNGMLNKVASLLSNLPEGITINDTPLGALLSGQPPLTIKLKSGETHTFSYQYIEPQDVETKTVVDEQVNLRNQNNLTAENLTDITTTIKIQQFYPAIGFLREDGVIVLLDGSRRRMSAILTKVGFIVLVSSKVISYSDAQQLAKDIQSSKEHNLKERGKRWLALNDLLEAKTIAEQENVSEATVSRGIMAAKVSDEMASLFHDENHLTTLNWVDLYKIENEIMPASKVTFDDLKSSVDEYKLENKEHLGSDLKDSDRKLVAIIKKLANPPKQSEKPQAVTEVIHDYGNSVKMQKKVSGARMYSLTFGRVSKEAQKEIEKAAQEILQKHYGKK